MQSSFIPLLIRRQQLNTLLIRCHLPIPVSDWPLEVSVCAAETEQADPKTEKKEGIHCKLTACNYLILISSIKSINLVSIITAPSCGKRQMCS